MNEPHVAERDIAGGSCNCNCQTQHAPLGACYGKDVTAAAAVWATRISIRQLQADAQHRPVSWSNLILFDRAAVTPNNPTCCCALAVQGGNAPEACVTETFIQADKQLLVSKGFLGLGELDDIE
jgi:hypothetical protein